MTFKYPVSVFLRLCTSCLAAASHLSPSYLPAVSQKMVTEYLDEVGDPLVALIDFVTLRTSILFIFAVFLMVYPRAPPAPSQEVPRASQEGTLNFEKASEVQIALEGSLEDQLGSKLRLETTLVRQVENKRRRKGVKSGGPREATSDSKLDRKRYPKGSKELPKRSPRAFP